MKDISEYLVVISILISCKPLGYEVIRTALEVLDRIGASLLRKAIRATKGEAYYEVRNHRTPLMRAVDILTSS